MKSFRMLQARRDQDHPTPLQPTLVIEISFRDIISMLFGRELLLPNKSSEIIVLRNATAYEAFNLGAPRAED